MRKIVNNLYIISIILIIISFVFPAIMLKQDENAFGIIVYKEIPQRAITTNVKNIYLVKAIHDIESAVAQEKIDSKSTIVKRTILVEKNNENMKNNIEKEIQKLAEKNIMKNIFEKVDNYDMEVNERILKKDNIEYTVNVMEFKINSQEYEFEIESKSGKILAMFIDKDCINPNFSKQEILEIYISYLGLDIIDDWNYENYWLTSKKADLIVTLAGNEEQNKYIMSIHSNELIDFAEWYKFDTNYKQLWYNLMLFL